MKGKIPSLFAIYIIFSQINFQEVFAQSSNETYKPLNDFYSTVFTAIIPLTVSILNNKDSPAFNILDDLIIIFSILLCPFLNFIENFDELPRNFVETGLIFAFFVIFFCNFGH